MREHFGSATSIIQTSQYRPWLHGILNYVLAETAHSLVSFSLPGISAPRAWEALAAALDSDAAETVPAISTWRLFWQSSHPSTRR